MDTNQERYFFLSGLLSISLFALLVFVAGYSIFISPKIERFAMVKSDVINVSIAIEPAQQTLSNTPLPSMEKTSDPMEENVQHIDRQKPLPQPEKVPEISDLFAQVKSQAVPKIKQENVKHTEQLDKLEKELMQPKDTSRFSDKVNTLALAKPSVKIVSAKGSEGPLVNEYHAKIQAIVTAYWHPPKGSLGHKAIINIRISPSGKLLGYKVIRYSGNGLFNSDVDRFEDFLLGVAFPVHPEKREANIDLDLMAI